MANTVGRESVRKRTDCNRAEAQVARMIKHDTVESRDRSGSSGFPLPIETPLEVFYVVLSKGEIGERDHILRSALYETRPQADTELARLRAADPGSDYGVWKSTTYIEPAEWLHRVVRADGTLILPRLHAYEKCS